MPISFFFSLLPTLLQRYKKKRKKKTPYWFLLQDEGYVYSTINKDILPTHSDATAANIPIKNSSIYFP